MKQLQFFYFYIIDVTWSSCKRFWKIIRKHSLLYEI